MYADSDSDFDSDIERCTVANGKKVTVYCNQDSTQSLLSANFNQSLTENLSLKKGDSDHNQTNRSCSKTKITGIYMHNNERKCDQTILSQTESVTSQIVGQFESISNQAIGSDSEQTVDTCNPVTANTRTHYAEVHTEEHVHVKVEKSHSKMEGNSVDKTERLLRGEEADNTKSKEDNKPHKLQIRKKRGKKSDNTKKLQKNVGVYKKRPSLLQRLLAPEIRKERNMIMQFVRHIVANKFYGVPVLHNNNRVKHRPQDATTPNMDRT